MKYLKHRVGDKVRIKSLEWYNANKDSDGTVISDSTFFGEEMSRFCGKEAIIKGICGGYYIIDIDHKYWPWCDENFEESLETPNISWKQKVKNWWKNLFNK